MGTPLASTRMWCLEPGRARSVGFGPGSMTFREVQAGLTWGVKRGLALLPEPHGVD
jgi:hypothetical protein